FFDRSGDTSGSRHDIADSMRKLFHNGFGIDFDQDEHQTFPTFEEAIGILDVAIARDEGIPGIGEREALGDLRLIRRKLVLALAATVESNPGTARTHHSQLVASLRDAGVLDRVSFVTT